MKEFDRFITLYKKLTEDEQRHLINMYGGTRELLKETTTYRLLSLIESNYSLSLSDIYEKLYNGKNDNALRKLLLRLTEKIFELFLNQDLINKNLKYDERAREIFINRKRLIIYDILRLRGMVDIANDLLENVIKESIKWEFYDIVLSALSRKKYINLNIKTTKINKNIDNLILKYTTIKENHTIIYNLYDKVIKQKSIRDINIIVNEYNSINIEIRKSIKNESTCIYYLCIVELLIFELKKDYKKCLSILNCIKKLMVDNPHLFSFTKSWLININTAHYKLILYDFEININKINNILEYGKINENNLLINYEYLFFLHYYNSLLKLSNEYLSKMIAIISKQKVYDYMRSNSLFYKCILLFINENFKDSLKNLMRFKSSYKDIEKWNMHHKVLCIMNCIELGELDYADRLIETLRKYVSKPLIKQNVEKRYQIISIVLSDLSRRSYDFSKTFKTKKSDFQKLASKDPDLGWQIMSPEMIVFDEWFLAKMKNEKYDHSSVMKTMINRFAPSNNKRKVLAN